MSPAVSAAGAQVAITRRTVRDPDGPPLVVLHGGGPGCHAASDFGAMLPLLGARDVVLVDLPGYGDSPLDQTPGGRFGRGGEILLGVLDALALSQVDVLAQSLGGGVALGLAATHPRRLRRLVLIGSQPVAASPGTRSDPGLGRAAREAYYASPRRPSDLLETVMRLEWHNPSSIPAALVAGRHAASLTTAALAVAADPSLLGQPDDLGELLPAVQAPTLVLWGRHDPFADVAYASALADRIPGAAMAVVEATAHHPQSERPEETAALVLTHLRSET